MEEGDSTPAPSSFLVEMEKKRYTLPEKQKKYR